MLVCSARNTRWPVSAFSMAMIWSSRLRLLKSTSAARIVDVPDPAGYSASVITQRCAIPAEKAKAAPRVRKTSSTTRTVRSSRPAAPP